MANIFFNAGIVKLFKDGSSIDKAGVWEWLLERSTSTYTPDKDTATLAGAVNFVEVTVASYARVTLTGGAVTADNSLDGAKLDADDGDFGSLEVGQTVKAIWIAEVATGVPLCRIDTDTTALLPRALGGGNFKAVLPVGGLAFAEQA
jgi:hypothetical protein